MKTELCPPRPEALIYSLRAFGYDLSMAIADLIDNSIYAKASEIIIDYAWNDGNPWICIIDNGQGMSECDLKEAMRPGSSSPLDTRQVDDLGRFGLGLKTASFSQCSLLTVRSKTSNGSDSVRCWDLEHVCRTKKWELLTQAPQCSSALLKHLDSYKHGTMVLWQRLDRLINDNQNNSKKAEEHFLDMFSKVVQYLEMVFHRFLGGKNVLEITVGRHKCEPWDPFLTGNNFTQELSTEPLAGGKIIVKPFVLPHVSKRTLYETQRGAGFKGWNAHQGFYLYRNRRMIIPGGYLDFSYAPEEHYKLCRIMIDLPNSFDHEWSIDVRKAAASPPSSIRADLERILKATRLAAVRVYRVRTGRAIKTSVRDNKYSVWLRKRRGDKILYEINRDHEVLRKILDEVNTSKSWERKLFHLIEKTVPHRGIIQDNAEHEDCHVALPEDISKPPASLLAFCEEMYHSAIAAGRKQEDAVDYVCAFFDDHIAYRIFLENIEKDNI